MFHHYLTKYTEKKIKYAESWIQLNVFGKVYTFSKKRIKL